MADYKKLLVWRKAHFRSRSRHRRALAEEDHLQLAEQVVEVRMMLHGLLRRLEPQTGKPEPPPRKVTLR